MLQQLILLSLRYNSMIREINVLLQKFSSAKGNRKFAVRFTKEHRT